jgi:hypothetical protein
MRERDSKSQKVTFIDIKVANTSSSWTTCLARLLYVISGDGHPVSDKSVSCVSLGDYFGIHNILWQEVTTIKCTCRPLN